MSTRTLTPPAVTDGMAEAPRPDLGHDAFVELTMMIAVGQDGLRP